MGVTAEAPRLRIAITGSGAMGGLFGARLARAGYETLLIDVDAARLAAINQHGLLLEDDAGKHRVRVRAGRAEEFAEPVDLLLVFTKSMHTQRAVRDAAHLLGPGSWALTLQNGLGNEDSIAGILGEERVAYGVTNWPADLVAPGHVRSHGSGMVRLWSLRNEDAAALEPIAGALNDADFACTLDARVKSAIWEKVIFNAAMNGITAITRSTVGGLADAAESIPLIYSVVQEGVATSLACGISVDAASIHAAIGHALANHRAHKPSMLQDIEARRATEVEAILGAIGRHGRSANVATPVIDTLTSLIKIIDIRP